MECRMSPQVSHPLNQAHNTISVKGVSHSSRHLFTNKVSIFTQLTRITKRSAADVTQHTNTQNGSAAPPVSVCIPRRDEHGANSATLQHTSPERGHIPRHHATILLHSSSASPVQRSDPATKVRWLPNRAAPAQLAV